MTTILPDTNSAQSALNLLRVHTYTSGLIGPSQAMLGPLAERTRQVRLVHGEPEAARALADALRERGFADVAVPRREETVSVE